MTYTIDSQILRAALLFSADKDIRFYLNGVYLSRCGRYVVASNGHAGIAMAVPLIPEEIRDVVIPNETVAVALKSVHRDGSRIAVDEKTIGGFKYGEIGEGKFPDWRKSFPTSPVVVAPDSAFAVQSRYLAATEKALRYLGREDYTLVRVQVPGAPTKIFMVGLPGVCIVVAPCMYKTSTTYLL